ncbi:MAG: DUF3823 domain-containing protein [Tannerella sp.]|jgi:hypothetical protein|nr:DUF3823 domain-containing protein [Tannerella sp.]
MKSKSIFKFSSALILLLAMASCGKDNYDAPESTLMGRLVYNGAPIQVRGTGEAVQLQLYQRGWQKSDPVRVYVTQDGTFTAKLFDGTYYLVTRDNNGPWVNARDTIQVELRGAASVDVNVTPYFTVSGENISISGNTLSASFTVSRVVSSAKIEKAYLVLSKTQFADEVNNIFRKDITEGLSEGSVSLSGDLSGNNNVATAKFLYGRVGIKTEGTEQAIWSPVVKLK